MKSSRVLRLLGIALACASHASVSSAADPAANEIILYKGEDFSGAHESYKIEPWMYQRIIDLSNSPLAQIRSFKAGSQVVVTGFIAATTPALRTPPLPDVEGVYATTYTDDESEPSTEVLPAVMGSLLTTQSRLNQPKYSVLVINHLRQMDYADQRRHPFGALLHYEDDGGWPVGADIERAEYVFLREDGKEACTDLNLGPYEILKLFGGVYGPSALKVILWPKIGCRGVGRDFPTASNEVTYFMNQFGLNDHVKSVSIVWKGPKLPDPPADAAKPPSRRAPESPDRRAPEAPDGQPAPEAPGDRRAPEAPDDPRGNKAQADDEITSFRFIRRVGDRLGFEVEYRVSSVHGATVYAGARLHAAGRESGGYVPAVLPSIGEGSVELEVDLAGDTQIPDEVEFFFFEGGQPPFVSRRFPFPQGLSGQVSPPKLVVHDYRGCFKDSHQRDLQGFHLENAGMTVNMCLSTCKAGGFSVAAVQFGSHCFCGDKFGRHGPATNCNTRCGGDASETCGGEWANGVFMVQ